ncbi:hypothetical protein KSS87_019780 [Heliosperma pusillum]|nr:hypothetical protein KSS87_019780 [Heliosperma pusillum]
MLSIYGDLRHHFNWSYASLLSLLYENYRNADGSEYEEAWFSSSPSFGGQKDFRQFSLLGMRVIIKGVMGAKTRRNWRKLVLCGGCGGWKEEGGRNYYLHMEIMQAIKFLGLACSHSVLSMAFSQPFEKRLDAFSNLHSIPTTKLMLRCRIHSILVIMIPIDKLVTSDTAPVNLGISLQLLCVSVIRTPFPDLSDRNGLNLTCLVYCWGSLTQQVFLLDFFGNSCNQVHSSMSCIPDTSTVTSTTGISSRCLINPRFLGRLAEGGNSTIHDGHNSLDSGTLLQTVRICRTGRMTT